MRRSTVLASVLALSLAALAQPTKASDQQVVVGAIYVDAQGFYAGVRKGVQDAGKAAGKDVQIIETNAQGDVSKESSFIDRLVSSGVQAIVVSAVSSDGSVRAIKRAHDAGIPIVCYNTCINPTDMKKYVYSYAVGDPFTFGSKLGDAAADYFKAAGKTAPKIAVINCEFVEVCVQRRKGFEKALGEKLPGYMVVANQEGTVLDNAISVAEKVITANGDLDGFFGESGGATLGAAKAVRNQGMIGKVVVFGSDMTAEIAQEVIDNKIVKADVNVSGQALGRLALGQALDAIGGKPVADQMVAAPIELYDTPEQAKAWLSAHPDGLP